METEKHSPGPFFVQPVESGLMFMLCRRLSAEERAQYRISVAHNGGMSLLAVDKDGFACVEKKADAELFALSPAMLMALNRIARLKTHKEMNPRRGNSEEYVSVQAVLDDCITQARAAISTTPSQP